MKLTRGVASNDAALGGLCAVMLSPVVGFLFAYLYRFPVILFGDVGPFGDPNLARLLLQPHVVLLGVAVTLAFYSLMYVGIPLVACYGLGCLVGYYASRHYAGSRQKNGMIVLWSTVADIVPIACLVFLGPY